MKLDKFLQLFVVKEKRFFPLFIQSAENIRKAAGLLVEQAREEDSDKRRIFSHLIKECETAGDAITDRIIDELLDAYVTPFDRDDIHQLAEDMDTFLDTIRDSSKKISIYQPKASSHKLISLSEYILKDAEILVEITGHFEKMRDDAKTVNELCDRIKENEHICDDLFESYMNNLFEMEQNAIELVKKMTIAQALEDTSDVAKSLSNTIRSIAVKMS